MLAINFRSDAKRSTSALLFPLASAASTAFISTTLRFAPQYADTLSALSSSVWISTTGCETGDAGRQRDGSFTNSTKAGAAKAAPLLYGWRPSAEVAKSLMLIALASCLTNNDYRRYRSSSRSHCG